MKKTVSLLVIAGLLSFVMACTEQHKRGTGVGAALGGIAGALLDKKNPWRGGVIGGALGGLAGATITDVSMRASQEAAATGKPVEYRTADGRGIYRADPMDYNAQTKCRKVRERTWEGGKLIKDQVKEICEGEKFERKY